jgi:hypothetical protein
MEELQLQRLEERSSKLQTFSPLSKMGTRNKHHNMRENGQGVINASPY